MLERLIAFVEYHDLELHPFIDPKHEWLLSSKEVCKIFEVEMDQINQILESQTSTLSEGRHYLYEEISSAGIKSSRSLLWTKKGLIRLAYYLKSDAALAFLDFAEDLSLRSDQTINAQSQQMYDEMEESLLERLKRLKKGENISLEELNKLIYTVDNLATKKAALESKKSEPSPLESLFSGVIQMIQADPNSKQSGMGNFLKKAMQERAHSGETEESKPTPDPFKSMQPLEKIKTSSKEEKESGS